MSDPVISPEDLGVYLDATVTNVSRAEFIISKAQALCESIVTPLPTGADAVVLDVTVRAWNNPTSRHTAALGTASVGYGAGSAAIGGLYLTRANKADLRRLAGRGGAFAIDMLPADLTLPAVPWDSGVEVELGDWDVPA